LPRDARHFVVRLLMLAAMLALARCTEALVAPRKNVLKVAFVEVSAVNYNKS